MNTPVESGTAVPVLVPAGTLTIGRDQYTLKEYRMRGGSLWYAFGPRLEERGLCSHNLDALLAFLEAPKQQQTLF